MILALKFFRHRLLGREFVIFTDHRPLTYWLSQPPVSERHARWIVAVQDLHFSIKYVPGDDNHMADALSRPTDATVIPFSNKVIAAVTLEVDHSAIKKAQTDAFIRDLPVADLQKIDDLWCDMSNGNPRILLPSQFVPKAIKEAHEIGHKGVKETLNLVKRSFVFKGMKKEVAKFVKHCVQCQQFKPTIVPKREPVSYPTSERFSTLHIDLVGPLPTSGKGNSYLFTMIDRYTRWVEAVPLSSITTEACAQALLGTWVSRFGIPDVLVSDQGRQFESHLFSKIMQYCGIEKHRTTPYHPQANAMVERCHRTLKDSLRCLGNRFADWEESLPSALLAMRVAVNKEGNSPALLVYGEHLSIPSSICIAPCSQEYSQNALIRKLQSNAALVKSYLTDTVAPSRTCDPEYKHSHVWIQDPVRPNTLSPRYKGPYKVLGYRHPVVTVEKNDAPYTVNVDRTKPAWIMKEYGPLQPEILIESATESEAENEEPLVENPAGGSGEPQAPAPPLQRRNTIPARLRKPPAPKPPLTLKNFLSPDRHLNCAPPKKFTPRLTITDCFRPNPREDYPPRTSRYGRTLTKPDRYQA
jgi:hypothetical protein